jgi:NAD(P)-dependent dehydrogenase (short-subunit alcohol dehydrogenase family)
LRFEVGGFGIDVIVVEPGAIATNWVDHAVATMVGRESEGEYADLYEAMEQRLVGAHRGLLRYFARSPEAVARVIADALEAERPRTRYVVPRMAGLFMWSRKLMPDRAWDAFMRTLYPTPGSTNGRRS